MKIYPNYLNHFTTDFISDVHYYNREMRRNHNLRECVCTCNLWVLSFERINEFRRSKSIYLSTIARSFLWFIFKEAGKSWITLVQNREDGVKERRLSAAVGR